MKHEKFGINKAVCAHVTKVSGGVTPLGDLVIAFRVEEEKSNVNHDFMISLDNSILLTKTLGHIHKQFKENGEGDVTCN